MNSPETNSADEQEPLDEVENNGSFGTVIKFGLVAGLIFGAGFWYAKLTLPKTQRAKVSSETIDLDDLKKRQAEYEQVQQRLKLGYFKELSAEPRRTSFANEPETTKQDESSPPSTPALVPTLANAKTPEPVNSEDPVPEPKAPKVEEQKPSSDRMAKALEKVLGKETPDTVTTAAKIKLPTQTGSPFAVQVASLPDRKTAEELANRLTLKGYAARLVQADIPGRGLVYRVRIHGYESRAEAEDARALVSKKERLDAITVAQ